MLCKRIPLNPSDDRAYLDTYVVNDRSHLRPAMIVIPGGGYSVVCTEREGEPIALAYVKEDFQCFVLNYRVGRKEDVYPAQMVDAGRAFLYVKENAADFGIDPEKIFFVGFSAGGHLAGCMGTMFNAPEVLEALDVEKDAIRPAGVVLSYPVTTAIGPCHAYSYEKLSGKDFDSIPIEEKRKYSLECNVTDSTVPMFLWHTATDQLVPVTGTLMLAAALTAHHITYACYIFPKGPHGVALANKVTDTSGTGASIAEMAEKWVEESVNFMKTL